MASEEITIEIIHDRIIHFQKIDDVFSSKFLRAVIIVTAVYREDLDDEFKSFMSSKGCKDIFIVQLEDPDIGSLNEGPYFYNSRGLFSAWRLFPDVQEAFVLSVIPSQSDPQMYDLNDP
jgi:hypothetical protein